MRDLGLVALAALVPLLIVLLWRPARRESAPATVTCPTAPTPSRGDHDRDSGLRRHQTFEQIAAPLQAEQPARVPRISRETPDGPWAMTIPMVHQARTRRLNRTASTFPDRLQPGRSERVMHDLDH